MHRLVSLCPGTAGTLSRLVEVDAVDTEGAEVECKPAASVPDPEMVCGENRSSSAGENDRRRGGGEFWNEPESEGEVRLEVGVEVGNQSDSPSALVAIS